MSMEYFLTVVATIIKELSLIQVDNVRADVV